MGCGHGMPWGYFADDIFDKLHKMEFFCLSRNYLSLPQISFISHGMHGEHGSYRFAMFFSPTDFYRQRLKDRWFTDISDFSSSLFLMRCRLRRRRATDDTDFYSCGVVVIYS